ncbi:cyclophane-forming radical SAM/SPASM peptide maturase GrrM/OscB [Streptomyces sp. NBC_01443]|uniref:cyclophane-forming radical SAM/SPASM peptide maturase GrrM/OscB n=1 Tax=Streptomyces sp. NBC_01443 TaxID=2903868 RepID=UPI00225AC9BC|nr:cyclophane-forming radical SAM/SPASM peptide maturase GrrM/OscB [Streptomyces sp. NBC_01443]MCX4633119.1 GRRM system radical SAM/SPASM domain protein [Streptomyces sp. NBC_01443]
MWSGIEGRRPAVVLPTSTVIVQPSPFCNIDCDYCYLPTRLDRTRMSMESVRSIVQFLFSVPEFAPVVDVAWHAGEPLVVPRSFYRAAFAEFARLSDRGVRCVHQFQTNGTLITEAWCEFMREHTMLIGLSIDGPAELHDRHRKDRHGRGTFNRAMAGAKLLAKSGIEFSVTSVLSVDSLMRPDLVCEWIEECGITSIGFNVEEVEGAHLTSTLAGDDATALYRQFFSTLYEFTKTHPEVRIREIVDSRNLLLRPTSCTFVNGESALGSILNFDVNGRVSTFSPELLTIAPTSRYRSFTWADVTEDDFSTFVERVTGSAFYEDLAVGVAACARECEYFGVCGGGAPGNKFSELGTVTGTETMTCRLRVKTLMDVMAGALEREGEQSHQHIRGRAPSRQQRVAEPHGRG